jgi:hypothetical protein
VDYNLLCRYKEAELEEDEPVCTVVMEKRCNGVVGNPSLLFYSLKTVRTYFTTPILFFILGEKMQHGSLFYFLPLQ